MEPFYLEADWKFTQNWPYYGFSYIYLKIANFDATNDDLMNLVEIDKKIYFYMGDENLEHFIFGFKALKIILNKEVKAEKIFAK